MHTKDTPTKTSKRKIKSDGVQVGETDIDMVIPPLPERISDAANAPSYQILDVHRNFVELCISRGVAKYKIANALGGLDYKTMQKYFENEYQTGMGMMADNVMTLMYRNTLRSETNPAYQTSAKFLAERKLGMEQKSGIDHTSSDGSGVILCMPPTLTKSEKEAKRLQEQEDQELLDATDSNKPS